MKDRLPKKLGVDVLIDVIFELRFESDMPAADILPGILFKELDGDKNYEKLSASEVPKKIRDKDDNLKFAPVTRISLDGYHINVGDRVVAVTCKLPYPGWESFRANIETVMNIVLDSGVIKKIGRYSLKYVDFIPFLDIGNSEDILSTKVEVGKYNLSGNTYNIRVEVAEGNIIHLLTLASNAMVIKKDESNLRNGIVVDVDSIVNCTGMESPREIWNSIFEADLADLHTKNKGMFFNCISAEGLNRLEPIYE